ncbi:hypothetical protein MBLNU459_g2002t1 [Dothideomycetes sp. NU459]
MAESDIAEPFPIFQVAHRHVLYDVNTISYIRRRYHITGVLIGGLPQAPQQNVFSGIPLELMPEEARLLVEKGVAYVVDDVKAHRDGFIAHGLSVDERRAFLKTLDKQGTEASKAQQKQAGDRKMNALKKIAEKQGQNTDNWNDIPDDMFAGPRKQKKKVAKARPGTLPASVDENDSLFGRSGSSAPTPSVPSAPSIASTNLLEDAVEAMKVTPTTSHPPLRSRTPPPDATRALPLVGSSYPLFKHMHSKDYFLAPGLRFGCQYMAYPGDPLRFHSHFLCNGMDWDEEFDLMNVVGGGRLGTGVKKGFLIGGAEPGPDGGFDSDTVRPFCIEWGGM